MSQSKNEVVARGGVFAAIARWFDTSVPFETTINFTQGACLWLLLTRRGVAQCYVKFSDCISLELEAKRCAAASRYYPQLVPGYVGHTHHDGLDVLVCRAVDFRGLNARQLQHGPVRDRSHGTVRARPSPSSRPR